MGANVGNFQIAPGGSDAGYGFSILQQGAHNAAFPGQWFFTIGRGMPSGERPLCRGVKGNRRGARSHAQAKTCPFRGRPG